VYAISERLDAEITAAGDEAPLVTVAVDVMRELPVPDMPLVVTIDGGYVHSSEKPDAVTAGSKQLLGP
jgi:hypothetical protein